MAGRQLALRPAQAWQQRFGPKAPAPNPQVWNAVATSQNGAIIAGVEESGYIWLSITGGAKWTRQTSAGSREWTGVAISSNGQVIIASFAGNGTAGTAGIAVTNNMGAGWRLPTLPFDMTNGLKGGGSVAISGSGAIMAYADAEFAEMYLSTNSGGTFNTITPPDASSPATTIAMSRDGSLIAAAWAPAAYAVLVNNVPKKFNSSTGAVIWSGGPMDLIDLSRGVGSIGIAIDSSGCVIVMGLTAENGVKVQKISADGTTSLWIYSDSVPQSAYIGVDSSDNIYFGATTFYKLKSSDGSLLATVTPPGTAFEIDDFCVTPNGVAICGGNSETMDVAVVATVTGSFFATWSTALAEDPTGSSNAGGGAASDASGTAYIGFGQSDNAGNLAWIATCNSTSGALTTIHTYALETGVLVYDVDSIGNIYARTNTSGYSLQKLSKTGTIAWTVSTPSVGGFAVACADGMIYNDPTNGATKLSSVDGTVVWNNAALAAHDDVIAGWARQQYKAGS